MNQVMRDAIDRLRPAIAQATEQAVGDAIGIGASSRNTATEIADQAVKEVAAVVVNQTNMEPWFQSRVTIGAIMTLIGGSYALGLDFFDGTPPSVDSLTAQLGAIFGAGTVIYGRWFAKKPLGQ